LTIAAVLAPGPEGTGGVSANPPKDPEGEPREKPAGITLPKITPVFQADWDQHEMDGYSALRAKDVGVPETDGNGQDGGVLSSFDFFLNMDNRFLKAEVVASKADPAVLQAQYEYGMALVGMGAIKHGLDLAKGKAKDEDREVPLPQEVVAYASDALAPMLLPMLNALGTLTAADLTTIDEDAGENT
jgi:hypothetical protein